MSSFARTAVDALTTGRAATLMGLRHSATTSVDAAVTAFPILLSTMIATQNGRASWIDSDNKKSGRTRTVYALNGSLRWLALSTTRVGCVVPFAGFASILGVAFDSGVEVHVTNCLLLPTADHCKQAAAASDSTINYVCWP